MDSKKIFKPDPTLKLMDQVMCSHGTGLLPILLKTMLNEFVLFVNKNGILRF